MDPVTIFTAVLAGIMCYQLYNVLGRKGGHEPEEETPAPFQQQTADSAEESLEEKAQPEPDNLPDWVKEVRSVYPDFEEKEFLTGAKSAYEMIVESFASNTLPEVKAFIAPGVYAAFHDAAQAREAEGHTSELQFVGTESASVDQAKIENGFINITVTFVSNQTRVLRNEAGDVIDGDPNRIDRVHDRWTFSRSVKSKDPNWQLVATGGTAPVSG
ncbi:Tim44/TimA family putative adaptor protein [Parvularcula sp. IMCC14364]|uniref:Tim44/TimA family putative adaptor protein n=1 Tax=Parvularcula sp. IMCC14364 TaxID=3067902 RepID=UPI00274237E7|nr:Tim44/TimA family putative adaptor protein [Parvularcula sp. IMCC14364]